MVKDLIEEAESCDLEPKAASLKEVKYVRQVKEDMMMETTGLHEVLLETSFKIPGYFF